MDETSNQHDAPRSTILLIAWGLVAVWQFWHLFHSDVNLIYSAAATITKFSVVAWCIRRGAWRVISNAIMDFWVLVALFAGGVLTFAITALIGGDLGNQFGLGFPCVGTTHWHHWDSSSTFLMLYAVILLFLARGQLAKAKRMASGITFVLLALAVAGFPQIHLVDAKIGMEYLLGAYMLCFGTLRWAMVEHGRKRFQCLVALELGIILAISLNGFVGIVLGLNGKTIPPALIFFNSSECTS